jgi:hypothetical protein
MRCIVPHPEFTAWIPPGSLTASATPGSLRVRFGDRQNGGGLTLRGVDLGLLHALRLRDRGFACALRDVDLLLPSPDVAVTARPAFGGDRARPACRISWRRQGPGP